MEPTVIIGLGGAGVGIVDNFYGRLPEEKRKKLAVMAMDIDSSALMYLKHLNKNDIINLGIPKTIRELIEENPDKNFEYLDENPDIQNMFLSNGSAQLRMVSRFAFEISAEDVSKKLSEKIKKILTDENRHLEVNIYLVSSLAGGTGSAILLPLALSLKNQLVNVWNRKVQIQALTLLPDVYVSANDVHISNHEAQRMRANAYAFFKEWKTYHDIYQDMYKDKDNLDLLEIKLLDMGNTYNAPNNWLTKTDFVLPPIDYLIGMDHLNEKGESLQYVKNYEKLIENYLYNETLSNLYVTEASVSNDALTDFSILVGNNRMASFGISKLFYPYEHILQLASASMINDAVGNNWLKIDLEYKKAYERYLDKVETGIKVIEPEFKYFFTKKFDELASEGKSQSFFSKLKNSVTFNKVDEFGQILEKIDCHHVFIGEFEQHIRNKLGNISLENKKAEKKSINQIFEAIRLELNIKGSISEYVSHIHMIERIKKEYLDLDNLEKQMKLTANALLDDYINFNLNNTQDVLNDKDIAHNLTHYIFGCGGEKLHPLAIRYFLYKLLNQIRVNKEKYNKIEFFSNGKSYEIGKLHNYRQTIEEIRNYDYYLKTYDKNEDVIEAINLISEEYDDNFFNRILNKREKESLKIIEMYKVNENEELHLIKKFIESTLIYYVLKGLENRIKLLIEYWENIFKNLQKATTSTSSVLQKIFYSKDYKQSNEILGEFSLFDDPELKEKFIANRIEKTSFDTESIEKKMSGMLYENALYGLAKYPDKIQKIEDVVDLDFTSMLLEKLQQELHASKVFDMNVLQALNEEAQMLKSEPELHVYSTLMKISDKASPYLNPITSGDSKHIIEKWFLSLDTENTLKEITSDEAYRRLIGEDTSMNSVFSLKNPNQLFVTNENNSNYELVKVKFEYNFGLNNLRDFDAIQTRKDSLTKENIFNTGGKYFKAYYKNKLGLWTGSDISTHLDKRWERLRLLNDINEIADNFFEDETGKAFIIGLAMGWFVSFADFENAMNSWKFQYESGGEKYDLQLRHIDGTPAGGSFKELLKALYANTGLVIAINGYYDDKNKYVKGFIDKQFFHDVNANKDLNTWDKHRLIQNIKKHIPYREKPDVKLSIFDVFVKLEKEKNSDVFDVRATELMKLTIDVLKDYNQRFVKQKDSTSKVKELIDEIVKLSTFKDDERFQYMLQVMDLL